MLKVFMLVVVNKLLYFSCNRFVVVFNGFFFLKNKCVLIFLSRESMQVKLIPAVMTFWFQRLCFAEMNKKSEKVGWGDSGTEMFDTGIVTAGWITRKSNSKYTFTLHSNMGLKRCHFGI